MSSRIYPYLLFIAASAVWLLAALNPLDRTGWLLENIIVAIFVPIGILLGRYFKLSNVSWTCITLFMILHIAGSHWTYAYVPAGEWIADLIGGERNMFDRVVHFSFGLLMAYPIFEAFKRITGVRGFWSYFFPLDIVLSLSALYEIFEWLTAMTLDAERAVTFMGSQGDFWDAEKDMACAAIGALIAMIIVSVLRMRQKADTISS
jgi:putative membrane protein